MIVGYNNVVSAAAASTSQRDPVSDRVQLSKRSRGDLHWAFKNTRMGFTFYRGKRSSLPRWWPQGPSPF